ncbi:MAG: glycosyltransferase [Gaiellaceae bacterium]
MVTYGGGATVSEAIGKLIANTDPCYELIVVDNASPDGAGDLVEAEVQGAVLVRNEHNEGFARASNQGADLASGKYLCFLNADAFVEPSWLAPLVETLERDTSVGAVVPLFLHPDGRIQEAGSVLDSKGGPIPIGDGDDPEKYENRFRRVVDFGSAACLVVRRDLFREVGGFDPAYSPAYYEDADFCFKIRERGFVTVVEPRSQVIHRRGGGSPRANALAIANRGFFAERWRERLEQRAPLANVFDDRRLRLAVRDAECLERILVIDDRVPHHDRGSGDPRMAKLLDALADLWPGARLTLYAADPMNAARYAPPLLDRGIEVAYADERFDRWFEERRFHYSVVLVSRASNIDRFESHLRRTQPQARRIYDIEALAFRRLEQAGDDLEALRWLRKLERTGVESADVVFCVSEEEARFARDLTDVPVFVLPGYATPLQSPPAFDEREGVVFFGGFLAGPDGPNEQAAVRLVEDVMPLMWEQLPELDLEIIGANPTQRVRDLHRRNVSVVGFVPDPVDHLARARVHIHPLPVGAGIKLKLIDTMAAGLPFVTTPIGAEGLGLKGLEDVVVADDPAELARLAFDLYQDADLWRDVQVQLLQIATERFGRDRFRATIVKAFTEVGVAPPPGFAVSAAA